MDGISTSLFLIALPGNTFVQAQVDTRTSEQWHDWRGDLDGFLDEQARKTLELVGKVIDKHRPAAEELMKRRMALLMLDNVLHEEKAPHRVPVQLFFSSANSGCL